MSTSVAYASADRKRPVLDDKTIEIGDAVDINQMPRPREAQRHRGNQALPARKHTAFLGHQFGQEPHRRINRAGGMIGERCRLHRPRLLAG